MDSAANFQNMSKAEIDQIWQTMENGKKKQKRKKQSTASTRTTSYTASRTGKR